LPDPDAIEALSKIANEVALKAIFDSVPKLKFWGDGYHPVEQTGYLSQDDKDFLVNLFSRLREDGLKALIDASQTDSPGTSRYQIVLSLIATEKEIPLLMDVLNRGRPTVAYFALKRLRELKAKSAAPKLKELVMKDKVKDGKRPDEPDSRLYRQAIWAIHDLGTVNDWLDIRFAKKDHPVIEILESPILQSGEKALPYLKKMIDDADKENQKLALEMIRDIKEGKTEQSRVMYY
jgi:HEAT repeat protein